MDQTNPAKVLKRVLAHLIDAALRTPDGIVRRRDVSQWPELDQEAFYALLDDPAFPLRRHPEGFRVEDPVSLITRAGSALDLQQLSIKLTWQEFERLVTRALEENDFNVITNARFATGARKKRWEVDVVGVRPPLLLAIDAKHWTRTTQGPAALETAAAAQKARVAALAQDGGQLGAILFQLGIAPPRLTLVPAVVTLFDPPFERAQCGVPVSSIRQLSHLLQNVEHVLPQVWTIEAKSISIQRRLDE